MKTDPVTVTVDGASVQVFPVGFVQYAEFGKLTNAVARAAVELDRIVKVTPEIDIDVIFGVYAGIMPSLTRLVDACCVPKLSAMNPPSGASPALAEAAIDAFWAMNFGSEEKARPLIQAAQQALARQGMNIDVRELFSLLLFLPGLARKESSSTSGPDGPTPDCPPSQSSDSPESAVSAKSPG